MQIVQSKGTDSWQYHSQIAVTSPDIRGSGEHSINQTLWSHPPHRQDCLSCHSIVVLVVHSSCQSKVCYLDPKSRTNCKQANRYNVMSQDEEKSLLRSVKKNIKKNSSKSAHFTLVATDLNYPNNFWQLNLCAHICWLPRTPWLLQPETEIKQLEQILASGVAYVGYIQFSIGYVVLTSAAKLQKCVSVICEFWFSFGLWIGSQETPIINVTLTDLSCWLT